MKASELVNALNDLIAKHGDLTVYGVWEGQVEHIYSIDEQLNPEWYGVGFHIDVDKYHF